MAKKVTVILTTPSPITSETCVSSWLVEYKLDSEASYTSFVNLTETIEIQPLTDASLYNIRITATCCNGLVSAPLTFNVDTTTTSP